MRIDDEGGANGNASVLITGTSTGPNSGSLQVRNSANTQVFKTFDGGSVAVGTITAPTSRLQVRGAGTTLSTTAFLIQNSTPTDIFTMRDDGLLSVFRPLTGTGTIATFYGYQVPYQLEASIEVGMQSSDPGVAVLGGSNVATLLGGFLQTKNGQRALSFNQLGMVSIGTTQISSSQYSALTVGGGVGSIGGLIPNKIGLQLASIPRTILHQGTGILQNEVAFNSFGISSLAANVTVSTYTNAYTVYIDGAPTAGNNVTFSNRYALYVNSGSSYFKDSVLIGTTSSLGNILNVSGSSNFIGSITVTGSITGSIFTPISGTFVLPLTSSVGPNIPTGSAYWSGSFLFIWDGVQYRSSSFS
jgi:hypothetical protein